MTSPTAIAGAQVALALAPPAAHTLSGYQALAFVPVRGVRVVGDLGATFQTTQFLPLGAQVPTLRAVARAPLSVQIDLARIVDAGQALLRQAAGTLQPISVRITLPGIGPHFFTAAVSRRSLSVGGGGDIADVSVSLEATSTVLEP